MIEEAAGPVAYGQLSVLRSLDALGPHGQAMANEVSIWSLPEDTSADQATDAWLRLVAQHESLRTGYDCQPAVPIQRVYGHGCGRVDSVALDEDTGAAAELVAAELAAAPIDIAGTQPWRARMTTYRGEPRHLVSVVHHVAVDYAALAELKCQFYARLRGAEPTPAAQPLELAHDQRGDPATTESTIGHWVDAWPRFHPEDRRPDDVSERRRAEVYSAAALAAARELSARLRVSVQSTVLAAGSLALCRFAGRDAVTFGQMAANRLDPRWASLISSLNQCVPLTVGVDEDVATERFLVTVYARCLDAYRHGMYDVDLLRARLDATGIDEPDPTFFAKYFNFLGELDPDDEPAADAVMRHGVAWRASDQRSGPNLHLVSAIGEGLYLGVGASTDLLPGNAPAVVAASIEAALISMANDSPATLREVSTEAVRNI